MLAFCPDRLARLSRILVAAGIASVATLYIYAGMTIVGLRNVAWEQARTSAETLLEGTARAVERDIELYDLSLQSVAERLRNPDLESASPEVRHLSLFDRAASAKGYGSIFVLDAQGEAFLDSGSLVPRKLNGADRAYFKVQRDGDAGLFIGRPWRTRVSGRVMIPLSRRFAYADGAFAGVIVGAIELDYFADVFARLNKNPDLKITILFDDGMAAADNQKTAQFPRSNALSDTTLASLRPSGHGSVVGTAAENEADHLFLYRQVGSHPLRVVVSIPTATIDAAWLSRAVSILLIVSVLGVALMVLLALLRRELVRRVAVEAELAAMALTDALTGIGNRRHFDQVLAGLEGAGRWRDAAIVLVDADFFKAYNDRNGHPAGDRVLKTLGSVLEQKAQRSGGRAFRIGGEEFAVILDGLNEGAVQSFAQDIRQMVETLALPHVGTESGVVTVSVGTVHVARYPLGTATEWLSLADDALYEAKRAGRNRVHTAGFGNSAGLLRCSSPTLASAPTAAAS